MLFFLLEIDKTVKDKGSFSKLLKIKVLFLKRMMTWFYLFYSPSLFIQAVGVKCMRVDKHG